MKFKFILLISLSFLLICSCTDTIPEDKGSNGKSVCLAVVLPGGEEKWGDVVNWCVSNLRNSGDTELRFPRIEIEWKDENDSDLDDYLYSVSRNNDIDAIIGPFSSTNARKGAEECRRSGKPILLPMATSVEVQRLYAGYDNIWNLVESDLTQCELLMLQARLYGKKEVSLLSCDTDYGKSFSDWFYYLAAEAGMKVGEMLTYSNEGELRNDIDKLIEDNGHYNNALIFVPDSDSDCLIFADEYENIVNKNPKKEFPQVLCSDNMFNPSLVEKMGMRSYEGLAPSSVPESGFNEAYYSRFGRYPVPGEAHVYDAILMTVYAFFYAGINQSSLRDALHSITSGNEKWNLSWLPDDMTLALREIARGKRLNLGGVTGDWTFDRNNKTSVLNTTYCHWLYSKGEYSILEYLSTDGGVRTTSQTQVWERKNSELQELDTSSVEIDYPAKENNWALVISTSDDWANYRHQADALSIYQLLKKRGFDDDHILYVSEDNIANNPANLYPGTVKVRPDGENLYWNVKVDYHLSQLKVTDLESLLTGKRSIDFPEVIESGENDNIFIYWCGHGMSNSLAWGEKLMSSQYLAYLFRKMSEQKQFRKIFFALDACYSGTIGRACEGIPEILVMTAANPFEPSKADMKDPEMGIWLSNGFTRAFEETLSETTDISIHDLYHILARHTVGSHVMLYNYVKFGNMYENRMSEFFPD